MSDTENQENLELVINLLPAFLASRKRARIPSRNSALTGASYYQELISTLNPNRFLEVARMRKPTFLALLSKLNNNNLESTESICAGQRLMIFIYLASGHSNRNAQERWQHSGDTISKIMHQVANQMLILQQEYVVMNEEPSIPSKIINSPKYYPYFQDCIGALDGTHIPAVVPKSRVAPYRNRKGFLSQNVLAVCDFDMVIRYVLAGWEGSAHDGRVYIDSLTKGFPLRAGKYYLGDAGYSLSRNVLTPYRGTRYHLKEWGQASAKPMNKKELFNLRHSSLRNVIERVFGVMKKRFPTLTNMPSYPFKFQVQMVKCIITMHNFIRLSQGGGDMDRFDILSFNNNSDTNAEILHTENEFDDRDISEENVAWRDQIATRMWDDYQNYNISRMN